MTGKTQAEAVTVLRNIPLGKAVQLVVSRQETEETETAEPETETVSSLKFCSHSVNFDSYYTMFNK